MQSYEKGMILHIKKREKISRHLHLYESPSVRQHKARSNNKDINVT